MRRKVGLRRFEMGLGFLSTECSGRYSRTTSLETGLEFRASDLGCFHLPPAGGDGSIGSSKGLLRLGGGIDRFYGFLVFFD